jgi:hypothetical protein
MTTLADLDATVRSYLNRPNLAEVPALVQQATGRLNRDLNGHPRTTERRIYTQPEGNPLLPLPDNLLGIIVLRQGSRRVPQYPPTIDTVAWGFVERGAVLHLYPTPTADTQYQLDYSASLAKLDGPDATNWVLEVFPDLYLYATLIESAVFLKDKESYALWMREYQDRLRETKLQGWNQHFAAGPRVREIK